MKLADGVINCPPIVLHRLEWACLRVSGSPYFVTGAFISVHENEEDAEVSLLTEIAGEAFAVAVETPVEDEFSLMSEPSIGELNDDVGVKSADSSL